MKIQFGKTFLVVFLTVFSFKIWGATSDHINYDLQQKTPISNEERLIRGLLLDYVGEIPDLNLSEVQKKYETIKSVWKNLNDNYLTSAGTERFSYYRSSWWREGKIYVGYDETSQEWADIQQSFGSNLETNTDSLPDTELKKLLVFANVEKVQLEYGFLLVNVTKYFNFFGMIAILETLPKVEYATQDDYIDFSGTAANDITLMEIDTSRGQNILILYSRYGQNKYKVEFTFDDQANLNLLSEAGVTPVKYLK